MRLLGAQRALSVLLPVAPLSCRTAPVRLAGASRSFSASAAGSSAAGAFKPPPVPKRVPTEVTFGVKEGEDRGAGAMSPARTRIDDLFWLRDDARKDEAVLAHLRAENAHTDAFLDGAAEDALYAELKSHLKETDASAAYPWAGYEYYTSTVEGLSYTIHCRRPRGGGEEQVLLDENALAAGKSYCVTGGVEPSPSHALLAYAEDTTGYETYTLRLRDLRTGADLADAIEGTAGSIEWGADDSSIYYTTVDDAHRPHKLRRHERHRARLRTRMLMLRKLLLLLLLLLLRLLL